VTKTTPDTKRAPAGRKPRKPKTAPAIGPVDDSVSVKSLKEPKRRGGGKDRILAAALDLFSNLGFDAVSTADIAQQAGSSQSVVLYHFKTKDALWQAAMRDLFESVSVKPTFEGAMYKDLDTTSRLRVLLRSFVLTSARHPQLGRVINREGASSTERMKWLFEELARPNYAAFESILGEGIERGLFKSYPPAMLTLLAHGAAASLFNLQSVAEMLLGSDPFAQEVVELQADMVVDLLLNGLIQPQAPARA